MTTAPTVFTSRDTHCWHRNDTALILSLEERPRPRISPDVLDSIERALSEAERSFATLVIASDTHFAFGADLNDAFDAYLQGHPEILDSALANYQRVMLRLRHANVPTVAAVQGVAISGGCELIMHCTRVVAHEQSRIGLFEAAVGVVPGGGGLKEFARRAAMSSDLSHSIQQAAATITAATVTSSAAEAQQLGFLTSLDVVDATNPLEQAIELGRALHTEGHVPPPRNPEFRVAGHATLIDIRSTQTTLLADGTITPHQFEVNMRVAQVLCGGRAAGNVSTEADLLALERQHFLALMQMPLTQERLAYIRSTGKPLMN